MRKSLSLLAKVDYDGAGKEGQLANRTLFVRARGQNYGPFTEEEFLRDLDAGRVPFSAWVYRKGGWSLLAADEELRVRHPEYEAEPKSSPEKGHSISAITSAAQQGGSSTISAEPVWFFVRDKKKHGPFSVADLVSKLQSKELDARTFVWRPGFETWKPLGQVSDFSRQAMEKLASSAAVDILVKRKTPRAPYEVEVLAHDQSKVIEGKSVVIGEGGFFLATPKLAYRLGARLKVHFRDDKAKLPAFNAVAEIVSVVQGDSPGYCMKFVALSDADRRRIAKFVTDRATSKRSQ